MVRSPSPDGSSDAAVALRATVPPVARRLMGGVAIRTTVLRARHCLGRLRMAIRTGRRRVRIVGRVAVLAVLVLGRAPSVGSRCLSGVARGAVPNLRCRPVGLVTGSAVLVFAPCSATNAGVTLQAGVLGHLGGTVGRVAILAGALVRSARELVALRAGRSRAAGGEGVRLMAGCTLRVGRVARPGNLVLIALVTLSAPTRRTTNRVKRVTGVASLLVPFHRSELGGLPTVARVARGCIAPGAVRVVTRGASAVSVSLFSTVTGSTRLPFRSGDVRLVAVLTSAMALSAELLQLLGVCLVALRALRRLRIERVRSVTGGAPRVLCRRVFRRARFRTRILMAARTSVANVSACRVNFVAACAVFVRRLVELGHRLGGSGVTTVTLPACGPLRRIGFVRVVAHAARFQVAVHHRRRNLGPLAGLRESFAPIGSHKAAVAALAVRGRRLARR